MPGETAREAVNNYVGPLQKALSCVTDAVLGHKGGYYVSPKPHVLTFPGDGSVPLPGLGLNFAFTQQYSIIQLEADGPYKVQTAYYAYGLDDSETAHEIFTYHWHPQGKSPVSYPHLHLEQGAKIGRVELAGVHLPTGRVALEDVLTFLIEQFGVKPRREDWRPILEETAGLFRKYRSWV